LGLGLGREIKDFSEGEDAGIPRPADVVAILTLRELLYLGGLAKELHLQE
jgi:hypothetical protein